MSDVALVALREADSNRLFEWINDRELVTLSAPFRPVSRKEHDAWFAEIRRRSDVRIFGIRLKDDDRLVGSCQLHHLNSVHRSAELQIRIGEADARGRGVGTAATTQLLEMGFGQLDLHRIYLQVLATNESARRMYGRIGFRIEGVQREAAFIDGSWLDVILMAMLADEFRPPA